MFFNICHYSNNDKRMTNGFLGFMIIDGLLDEVIGGY